MAPWEIKKINAVNRDEFILNGLAILHQWKLNNKAYYPS